MIPQIKWSWRSVRLPPQLKLSDGDVSRHVLTGFAVAELYRNQSKTTGETHVVVHR
jgi:hypothetical protein